MIEQVGADRVGAFFCEPVIGAGGVYFPPDGYLAEVQQICRDNDVLFVADEVITGFGRTGEWFGSDRYGLEPDMMTVAKGLTSGYLPLGAVVAGPRVAEPFWRAGSAEIFRHGYTYSAHPAACAVGLANLDIVEREQLVRAGAGARAGAGGRARAAGRARAGGRGADRRRACSAPSRSPPGGAGADPASAPASSPPARERGVITRLLRGVALQVSPPFVITAAELSQIGEVFAAISTPSRARCWGLLPATSSARRRVRPRAPVKGCSRAIRMMVPSGSASQGMLSSSTMPKCGLAWMPLYSSARMMSTTALMEPDQISAGHPDPLPAAADRIQRRDIERAVPEHVNPDRHAPERRPGHQQRVVLRAVGMHHVDDGARRPGRVAEVDRVRDGQLLDVHEVGDEEQVDGEEGQQDPVDPAAAQRNDLAGVIRRRRRPPGRR